MQSSFNRIVALEGEIADINREIEEINSCIQKLTNENTLFFDKLTESENKIEEILRNKNELRKSKIVSIDVLWDNHSKIQKNNALVIKYSGQIQINSVNIGKLKLKLAPLKEGLELAQKELSTFGQVIPFPLTNDNQRDSTED